MRFPHSHAYLGQLDASIVQLPVECKSVMKKCRVYGEMGLSLPASRILKTVFFSSRGDRIYGAVVPGDAMVDPAALERTVLDDLWSRHECGEAPRPHYSRLALRKASTLPTLMTYGTCSPCISAEDVRSDWRGKPLAGNVGRIVVDIDDETALSDLPFPGRADVAMHARFSDVHALLEEYAPGVVIRGKARMTGSSASYPLSPASCIPDIFSTGVSPSSLVRQLL